MERTLNIDGMMCQHCVEHVRKALSAIEGVIKVDVDLQAGTARVEMKEAQPDFILQQAVEAEGYKVLSII